MMPLSPTMCPLPSPEKVTAAALPSASITLTWVVEGARWDRGRWGAGACTERMGQPWRNAAFEGEGAVAAGLVSDTHGHGEKAHVVAGGGVEAAQLHGVQYGHEGDHGVPAAGGGGITWLWW